MKQFKVIIVNIIIVLLAVASIVTLYLGSFMKIALKLTVNNENVEEVVELFNTNKKSDGGEESSEDNKKIDVSALGEFSLELPLSLNIKNEDALTAVFSDRKEVVTKFIDREVSSVISTLLDTAKDIFKTVTTAIVNKVVEEAKTEIEKQISENTSSTEVLQEEYGISEEDITTLKTEVSNAVNTVLEGGNSDDIKKILEDSQTLDDILLAYSEAKLKTELGVEELNEEQKTQAQADASSNKNDFLDGYDKAVEKFADEEGTINASTIINGVISEAGITSNDGESESINSEEELVEYVSTKINTALEENKEYIGYALMGMGIFVLIVMASWAYVVIKIIAKLFSKNKTIRFGVPQAFGWMPHVFFVGLPMSIIKLAKLLVEKFSAQLGEEVTKIVDMATEFVQLNVSSLTWVSAACTVGLLVISFFYYKWRKQINKEKI